MNIVYDVFTFGAQGDGKTLDTEPIQSAIDACHQAGGGRVLCGPGEFLIGSLEIKSHVELHLAPGCQIIGSTDLKDYTPLREKDFHKAIYNSEHVPENSAYGLITAVNAEDISITGSGLIDGSGFGFYETANKEGKFNKPGKPRPRLIMFYRCKNVRVQDTQLVNSACYMLWLLLCENVHVHRIQISGDRRMRNLDGINIDACRDVTVSDCRINTEDDCIVLRAIQKVGDSSSVCENIVVTNCVLDSGCQGVRIGCPGDGIIRNSTFSNLVIHSSKNGIVFENPHRYLPPGGEAGAHITNILFSNIVVSCSKIPIKIVVAEGIQLSRLAELSFSHFRIQSGGPCLIQGSSDTTIEDVCFTDIRLKTAGNDAIRCSHCKGVKLSGFDISN